MNKRAYQVRVIGFVLYYIFGCSSTIKFYLECFYICQKKMAEKFFFRWRCFFFHFPSACPIMVTFMERRIFILMFQHGNNREANQSYSAHTATHTYTIFLHDVHGSNRHVSNMSNVTHSHSNRRIKTKCVNKHSN